MGRLTKEASVHTTKAKKASVHSAGPFHFAILVPDRKSLASTFVALRNSGLDFDGLRII